eukprot:c269_g1_i1.p1 GENE.c269_g1_i1~~c269_g1_i1.p1  ORF type:complete len:200 (-),score=40.79 c269_g1_i1:88-687(-)
MGNSQARTGTDLTPEELDEYVETSFFTKGEIVELRHRFLKIGGGEAGDRVPAQRMLETNLLEFNPFKQRIVRIFSSDPARKQAMNFDDFLAMCTAFSSRAPKQLKIQAAFKIYDFDDNGFIDKDDVSAALSEINGSFLETENHWEQAPKRLTNDQIDQIAEKVIREIDVDGSGRISFYEFSKVVERVPDFKSKFRFSGL